MHVFEDLSGGKLVTENFVIVNFRIRLSLPLQNVSLKDKGGAMHMDVLDTKSEIKVLQVFECPIQHPKFDTGLMESTNLDSKSQNPKARKICFPPTN